MVQFSPEEKAEVSFLYGLDLLSRGKYPLAGFSCGLAHRQMGY